MDRRQLERLLQVIAATHDRELTCADLDAEHLAEFVDLELAGKRAGDRMPGVARHLMLCPDCRRDYEAVLELLRAAEAGELIEPPSLPNFDLSFVSRARARDVPVPWHQVSAKVRRYVGALPVLALRELQRLGQLPAGVTLHPAAAAPPRMRGAEPDTPPIALRLSDAATGFGAELSVRLAGGEVAWITVRPDDVAEGDTTSRLSVALLDDDGRVVELRAVPANGTVEFRDVPIRRPVALRFQRGEEAWEVALDLRSDQPDADVAE